MTSARPLAGVRVVITRPVEQSGGLRDAIEKRGGTPVAAPLIALTPRLDEAVLASVRHLNTFDALVITSSNAVQVLESAASKLGIDLSESAPRCYTVGQSTAETARKAGMRAVRPDDVKSSRDLADYLVRQATPDESRRLLLPRGQLADTDLPSLLRDAGYAVTEIVCYETGPAHVNPALWQSLLQATEPTVITLFSPSAVHALCALRQYGLEPHGGNVQFACIGQTTAGAARKSGLPVHFIANQPSEADMMDAICQGFVS